MVELREYIRGQCVLSKLSAKPLVGRHEGVELVFVQGYPMTLRGFYILTSRAVFGATVFMSAKIWSEMDAETELLCDGLSLPLPDTNKARAVVDGIRDSMGWNIKSAERQNNFKYDRDFLYDWVREVEQEIALLRGLVLDTKVIKDLDDQLNS